MDFQKLTPDFSDPEIYSAEIKKKIRSELMDSFKGHFSSHEDEPFFVCRNVYSETCGMPQLRTIPDIIRTASGIDLEQSINRDDILVFDLETTGLGRGGTMAFMIGLGYFEEDLYIVEQIFLPHPDAEINSFDRLLELLETRNVLVSFNGKTFDLPVLESRFAHAGIWHQMRDKAHIDVLQLARKLWRKKVPSCALETLEYYILGIVRDKELDIPGAMVPQTYYNFLVSGDSSLIKRIFVHNEHDVLNTAILLDIICNSTTFPIPEVLDYRIDYHALGLLYINNNEPEIGKAILMQLWNQNYLSPALAYDLGMIHKRQKDLAAALEAFSAGAALDHPGCIEELIIIKERQHKDYQGALKLCEKLRQRYYSMAQGNKLAAIEKKILRLRTKIQTKA